MGYPQITYPAAAPTTTLSFTLPPKKKPGTYPIGDQEGVGAASITLSGLRQVLLYREDDFYHLFMEDVPWADMPNWALFISFALTGQSFLYYPDSAGTAYDEYWLEDLGGSARSSSTINNSSSSSQAFNPQESDRQHATFELVFRKVPGGLTHG